MYRVNYGNGQVSRSFDRVADAYREQAQEQTYPQHCYVQFQDQQTGEWFRYRGHTV